MEVDSSFVEVVDSSLAGEVGLAHDLGKNLDKVHLDLIVD